MIAPQTNNGPAQAEIEQLVTIWRDNIPLFANQMFGADLRPKQIEMANAFKNNRKITIKGGVGFGKTFVLSIISWWAIVCHSEVLVTILGPSEQQLDTGAWRAISALHSKMHPAFKEAFTVTATKVERTSSPASCRIEKKLANSNNIASLRGIHEINNFIIVDEASGIEDTIFEDALLNIFSDANPKLLLISNPNKLSGYFYRTFNDPQISDQWKQITGKATDNPGLTDEQLAGMVAQYGGKHTNQYQIMVEGNFPTTSTEGLISRNLCAQAVDYEVIENNAPIVWGLDPAGDGGDRSVLCMRKGNQVLGFHHWSNLSPTDLGERVVQLYKSQPSGSKPSVISVDVIGVGLGVASILKDSGIEIKSTKVNNKPTKRRDDFKDLKAQLWWSAKEWFETEEVEIPDNGEFIDELCVTGYQKDTGKIAIEAKKAVRKKLGGKSTDFADAFILTFAVSSNRTSGKYAFNKPIRYDNLAQFE